ncbi:MAG: UbiD family decarboxylase [Planctomycetota bacterium]
MNSVPDLRAFIAALRSSGELVDVTAEVDPHLEIAEIHRRVIAANGPALLFHNVKGSRFRVVTNLFGTNRRAERAFGERSFDLVRELIHQVQTLMPPTAGKLWGARHTLFRLVKVGLKHTRSAPVTEVVSREPDLGALPVTTSWPKDGGPFLTLPLVYTEHPDGRGHNLGIYRMQRYDSRTTGMHWQIAKGGGFHHHAAASRGESLPVTVFLGGPPALILAAIAPLPENVPELMLASLLLGERLRVTRHPACPHPLVAAAEFALVGHAPPHERRTEGPFGDHYGYYSLAHAFPVFKCDTLFHRRDAIYPATTVGKPRQEDFYIGDLLQKLLSPLFPLVMPGVRSLWAYGETGYHALAAAVVHNRYFREAMASGFRILGEGQLSLTKFLLLTDQTVDLHDFRKTLEHILCRTHPETDLYVFSNLSTDTLDYTGPRLNEGSKGIWLGMGDPVRELPREFRGELPAGARSVRVFCGGCLVVECARFTEDTEVARRIARDPATRGWPLVVVTDDSDRATRSPTNFLWTTFTRFEPAADLCARDVRVVRNHLCYEAPIVIDARLKPGYPEELHADPETAARVTQRWREYFPAVVKTGAVEMGDAERAHLD